MPAIKCPIHGVNLGVRCCTHVVDAMDAAEPLDVWLFRVEQADAIGGLRLCLVCRDDLLALPEGETAAAAGPKYEEFSESRLLRVCDECFGAWYNAYARLAGSSE